MSQKFKEGDSLRCVDDSNNGDQLTQYEIYIAQSNEFKSDRDCEMRIRVIDDNGHESNFYASRFTLHTPKQSTMPESNPLKEEIEAQIVDMQRELARVEHELEGVDGRVKEAVQYLKDEEYRQRATAAKCDRLRSIIKLLNSHLQ